MHGTFKLCMMKDKGTSYKDYHRFFDRDLSWLRFNERVLDEAANAAVPLMERIRFVSIYSSNLDEFYRVRMPALLALHRLGKNGENLPFVNKVISDQLDVFGDLIKNHILPELRMHGIHLIYNEAPPEYLQKALKHYFIHHIAGFIRLVRLSRDHNFFPENNKLYLAVNVVNGGDSNVYIVNIPSDSLPRFFLSSVEGKRCIVFIDDIVRLCLPLLFPTARLLDSYSFKITRDAELDLEDEFKGNLARKIEQKIQQRDFGLATRILCEPGFDSEMLELLKTRLNLKDACFVVGGRYHNLKDFSTLPINDIALQYPPVRSIEAKVNLDSLFDEIRQGDRLLHPPYQNYDTVIRFFNQAAIDPDITSIQVTLYRVATESRIVNALIGAAKNGKDVVVFVELKARFDEANNIRWSKKMRAKGVRIIESIPGLKVHAKIALVKRKTLKGSEFFGLLSTGNFNESTARFYTDHILITANKDILSEVDFLFKVLRKTKSKEPRRFENDFKHLLVGHFNLQQRFIALIDREIMFAKRGLPALINIKFNNLEDKVLITKLYEASNAGVKIHLIVRGICCLIPGAHGPGEKKINVTRIVDRFLEHGRIFIFGNNGDPEVFLGSADWMNRNIYRRIEVCFPVYDNLLKAELLDIVHFQLQDNVKAVSISTDCTNVPVGTRENSESIQSQIEIMKYLRDRYEKVVTTTEE